MQFLSIYIVMVMTAFDCIVDSKQTTAFRCWISFFLSLKPQIKDIKDHRRAVRDAGFLED